MNASPTRSVPETQRSARCAGKAPLARDQRAARWQALCNDPAFEDVAGKIELTGWGEIPMSPLGKLHGLVAVRVAEHSMQSPGGRTNGAWPSTCPVKPHSRFDVLGLIRKSLPDP